MELTEYQKTMRRYKWMRKLIGTKSYSLTFRFESFRIFGVRIVWWYWSNIIFQIIILDHCINLHIMFKWSRSHKNIWIDIFKPVECLEPKRIIYCGKCCDIIIEEEIK